MSEHGRIVAVTERPLGSTLVADTAAGVTTLTVVDAAEFDDQSDGWLSINGQVIKYASVDDDTGIITLANGSTLTDPADEGDAVLVYDQLYDTIAVDKRADVVLDGADDNTDAIDAGIALHLVDKLDTGIRGDTGESVILEEEAGDWKIIDVLGLGSPDAAGIQFDTERLIVDTLGDQVLTLRHEPIADSVHLRWHPAGTAGVDLDDLEWTLNEQTITLADPESIFESGDKLTVKYAYRRGVGAGNVFSNVEFSAGQDNPLSVPSDAADGDLLVAIVCLPSDVAATALNGYTEVGETASITHGGAFGDTFTYRLAVYVRTKPEGSSPVPTFNASVNDTPWILAAFRGRSKITDSAFSTVGDATSAATPGPADIRIWATIGDHAYITAHDGVVSASSNTNSSINIIAVTGVASGTVDAGAASTAGWMLSSLVAGA